MALPKKSYVQDIQPIKRIDNSDRGDGTITQQILVRPYTSAPFVELYFKGTIVSNGDSTFSRIKPATDFLKPWFYCTHVITEAIDPRTIRGCRSFNFNPSENLTIAKTYTGQQASINDAMQNIFDHDFAGNLNLTPAEIMDGGADYSDDEGSEAFHSKGAAQALMTITYKPLVILDGIINPLTGMPNNDQNGQPYDPFDYTIQEDWWTPVQKNTQLGRDLQFILGTGNPANNKYAGGVAETATVPEQIVRIKLTRKMCPYVPENTFAILQSKINNGIFTLGNLKLPYGTVRFETPITRMGLSPDNKQWYDIDLIFSYRRVYDTCHNVSDTSQTVATGYNNQFATWNQHIGFPTLKFASVNTGVQYKKMAYYTTGWANGLFNIFGAFRGLHLYDSQVGPNALGVLTGNNPISTLTLSYDPFITGFKNGQ